MNTIPPRGPTARPHTPELIGEDPAVALAHIYAAGSEALAGTMRSKKKGAERRVADVAVLAGELERVRLDAEAAEFELWVKSLQTELVARQTAVQGIPGDARVNVARLRGLD